MEIKSKLLNALIADKRINNGIDKKIKIIIYYSEGCDEYAPHASMSIRGEYKGIRYRYFEEQYLSSEIQAQTRYDDVSDVFFDMFPANDDKDFKDVRKDRYHVNLNKIDDFVDFLEILTTDTLIPYSEF